MECDDIFESYLMSSSSLDDLNDFDQYRYGDGNVLPIKITKVYDDAQSKTLKPITASVSEHTVSIQSASKESDSPEKSLLRWTWCAQKILHAFKQEPLSSSVDAVSSTKTLVSQLHRVLYALQSCISKIGIGAFCQLDRHIASVAQSLHSMTTSGPSMVNEQRTKFVDKLRILFAEIHQKVSRTTLKARCNLEGCVTKVKLASAKSMSFLSQAASMNIFDKNFDCESYSGSKPSTNERPKECSKAFKDSKFLRPKPSLLSSITATEQSNTNKAAPKPSLLSIFDCADIEEIINQEDIIFNCLCANQLLKTSKTNLKEDCGEVEDDSTKQVPNLSAHSELKSPDKSEKVFFEKSSSLKLNLELNLANISEPAESSFYDCPLDLRNITSTKQIEERPKQQPNYKNSQGTNEMVSRGDFERFARTLPIPLVVNNQEATAVGSKIKPPLNDVIGSVFQQKPLVSIHPLRESSSHIYSMISSDEASSNDVSPIDLSSPSQTSLRLAVSKLREEMSNLDNVLDLSIKLNKARHTCLPPAPNQTSHKTTQCAKASTVCKQTQHFAGRTKSAAVQCKTVTKLVMNSDCQTDDIFSSKPATKTSKLQTDVSLLRAAMADVGVQTTERRRPTLTRVTTVCSMTPYDVNTDSDDHVRAVTCDENDIDLLKSISSTSTLCDYEPPLPTALFHHAKAASSKASTVSTPSADFRSVASSSDGGGDCCSGVGDGAAAYGVLSSEDLASVCRSVLDFLRTNG